MIKTWLIDALRNVWKRIVSWLSIATIVFIGTTLILGLYFASSTVRSASVSYIDERNFRDFDISCSLGIKEDEIARIRQLEGFADAEGQLSCPGVAICDGINAAVTVVSATERISVPMAVEGTMPSSDNECAISFSAMNKLGAKLGDEIEINISSARFERVLKSNKYKITAVASHPDYMVNISTDYIVLPFSCFDTSDLSFDYSNILVDADIDQNTFSTAYKKISSELEERIKKETDSMSVTRTLRMNEDLDEEYENARKKADEELSKGKAELDDARKLFDDTVGEALSKLTEGEEQLSSLKDTAEKELAEAKRKIKEGEEEYNRTVSEGAASLEQAQKDMEKELDLARWQLFSGMLEIDKNEKLLKEQEEEYNRGLEKYGVKLAEYRNAKKQFDTYFGSEGLQGYANVYNTYAEYSQALDDETREKYRGFALELQEAAGKGPEDMVKAALSVIDNDETDVIKKSLNDQGFDVDAHRSELDSFVGASDYLNGAKNELEEARKLLDQGWYTLEQAKKQLAEGEAELARKEPEAKKQLEDAKAEYEQKKAEGASQLEEAKKELASKQAEAEAAIAKLEEEISKATTEYNIQKEDGEKELADATKQYEEARKETEEKLSELEDQIEAVRNVPCTYLIRTRDVNFPYVQTVSYVKAINGFFSAFTPLYACIVAIVCFFTMTIIIQEQTSQIGTCKAFGMYESEIMRKYMVFGVSAALFGALAGVVGGFTVEGALKNTMKNTLAFSLDNTERNVFMLVLLPMIEVLITVVAVIWSCHRYIRCSAVGLINGNEPARRYRKKAGKAFPGSLYMNLIINNLRTDIGREVVSVVTIVLCVFIVGFGIDIKLAYEGALRRQMKDIWKYDITLTESGKITDEQKAALRQELSGFDTLYLPISAGVIADGDSQILTRIICVDDEESFNSFYKLKDDKGRAIGIPENSMLVTREMEDKNGIHAGDKVNFISLDLDFSSVDVGGTFLLYAGKTVIMRSDYYSDRFGSAPVSNTYYIKAGGESVDELAERLSLLPGVSQVELTRNLRDGNMAVVNLYNAVVAIVIIFSIMLSFMILLNLSNILVAHRMRELLTMRVNGFSKAHVIGYLVREVIATGLLSVVIALALGVPLTGVIIKNLETDAFMFVRQPFALAWMASVLINTLFSVIINSIAFRNVNSVPLTDISKY